MKNQILISTATLLTLTPSLGGNDYFNTDFISPNANFTETFDPKTSSFTDQYDYFQDKFTIRDLAEIMYSNSRGFTIDEAKSYNQFISEFFS